MIFDCMTCDISFGRLKNSSRLKRVADSVYDVLSKTRVQKGMEGDEVNPIQCLIRQAIPEIGINITHYVRGSDAKWFCGCFCFFFHVKPFPKSHFDSTRATRAYFYADSSSGDSTRDRGRTARTVGAHRGLNANNTRSARVPAFFTLAVLRVYIFFINDRLCFFNRAGPDRPAGGAEEQQQRTGEETNVRVSVE